MTGGGRLRILMVTHTPWTRDLGAPRVQLELAEELRSFGDVVEKFSFEDAFPERAKRRSSGRLLGALRQYLRSNLSFAARARAYVRANAARFDVVDAHQTNLPCSKRDLGFNGLLVARSVGLVSAYRQFEDMASQRWPEPRTAREMARSLLTYPGRRRNVRDIAPSFRFADLINVSNRDDLETLRRQSELAAKVMCQPFGMSASRLASFRAAQAAAGERLAFRTVAFIGAWTPRKGSKDWPAIVSLVRSKLPQTRFLFLGTGFDRSFVLREFPPAELRGIEVVPAFKSEELPALLLRATVGAYPGYLEGFGFSVLEKLASGLPIVAYDAPGTRDMLRHHAGSPMVAAGDVHAFSDRVIRNLALPPEAYAQESAESRRVAELFRWRDIASATRTAYREHLSRLASC